MSRLDRLLAALLLVTGLAGCSSIGSMADKLNPFTSAPKAKPAELQPIRASAELRSQWQASIGAAGDYVFTPAISGNSVYVASQDGVIARLDNGREVWRIKTGEPLSGGVGSDGHIVAVATPKGEVLTFDAATGKPGWKARAASEVLAAPAVGEGLVVVRSSDAQLVGLAIEDGSRRWTYQRTTPALTLRSDVSVTMIGGGILAGFPGGKLVAISPKNGAAIWELTIALPKGTTELERIADITSDPVVDGREACAVAYQGRVSCIDLANGNTIWSRDVSSSAGLDIDARAVYVSDEKGTLHAFDRYSGAVLWKQDKLANRVLSRPLAIGAYVVVADGFGYVHVLKTDNGSFAARTTTDGSAIRAKLLRLDHGFVAQTKNGNVFAFDVK